MKYYILSILLLSTVWANTAAFSYVNRFETAYNFSLAGADIVIKHEAALKNNFSSTAFAQSLKGFSLSYYYDPLFYHTMAGMGCISFKKMKLGVAFAYIHPFNDTEYLTSVVKIPYNGFRIKTAIALKPEDFLNSSKEFFKNLSLSVGVELLGESVADNYEYALNLSVGTTYWFIKKIFAIATSFENMGFSSLQSSLPIELKTGIKYNFVFPKEKILLSSSLLYKYSYTLQHSLSAGLELSYLKMLYLRIGGELPLKLKKNIRDEKLNFGIGAHIKNITVDFGYTPGLFMAPKYLVSIGMRKFSSISTKTRSKSHPHKKKVRPSEPIKKQIAKETKEKAETPAEKKERMTKTINSAMVLIRAGNRKEALTILLKLQKEFPQNSNINEMINILSIKKVEVGK